jgi:hypothetical protein
MGGFQPDAKIEPGDSASVCGKPAHRGDASGTILRGRERRSSVGAGFSNGQYESAPTFTEQPSAALSDAAEYKSSRASGAAGISGRERGDLALRHGPADRAAQGGKGNSGTIGRGPRARKSGSDGGAAPLSPTRARFSRRCGYAGRDGVSAGGSGGPDRRIRSAR